MLSDVVRHSAPGGEHLHHVLAVHVNPGNSVVLPLRRKEKEKEKESETKPSKNRKTRERFTAYSTQESRLSRGEVPFDRRFLSSRANALTTGGPTGEKHRWCSFTLLARVYQRHHHGKQKDTARASCSPLLESTSLYAASQCVTRRPVTRREQKTSYRGGA